MHLSARVVVYCLHCHVSHKKNLGNVSARLHQASVSVCVNAAMMLATQSSLITMESFQNVLQPHSQVTVVPNDTVLQASSQH